MHTSSSRFSTCRRIVAAFIACCVGIAATQAYAINYTWKSATTGGSWSVNTNWDVTGVPTSGDTALLDNATVNRTVFYDTAASGTLTGLSFTQTTSGVLNELLVQRGIAVTNAVTLGASSGTARLQIAPTLTGTFSNGISVNTGGVLLLSSTTASTTGAAVSGNVTIAGGILELGGNATSQSTSHRFNNDLTMSSGTFNFGSAANGRQTSIFGNLNITGGTVLGPGANVDFRLQNTTNVYAPTTGAANVRINLEANSNQTLTGTANYNLLFVRGTGIKTVSNSGTINQIGMADAATGSGRTTLRLASNLTVGSGGLGRAGFGDAGTSYDYGVDADIYTLDLTAASSAWTPSNGGTGTTAQWALTGTAGRIIANGFVLNTANVGTTVGPGLILESRAGNSVANNLSLGTSGTGAIDATSVFRYAGTAAVATPSTLVSTRGIGLVEVTSGALQVSSLPSLAGARLNGGTLIATSSSALPGFGAAGFVVFNSGTLQLSVDGSAWTMDQVDTLLTNATKTSGGLAINVASGAQTQTGSGYSGGIGLTKLGSGTLALSTANTYTGTTAINAGVLSMGNGSALGSGTVSFGGGTLQYGLGITTDISSRIASSGSTIVVDTGGNEVTWASSIASSNSGGLTKQGAGTLTLSASNAYTGATTIASGTLALTGGDNRIVAGGDLAFTGTAGLNISGSQSLATVTVANNVAATVAGGGRLTLTGAALQIGGTATQSLDASGLAAFAYTNAAGTMTVGGADLAAASSGVVVLPASATITASALRIGSAGNVGVNSGTLTLGASTTISSSTIALGSNQSQGTINVAAGTVNPVLRLRGTDGTSAVSNMTIGTSDGGYGLTTASRVDLTGGTGASTLDALVTNLVIGQNTRSTSFAGALNTSGGLLMQSGTLTATTITLGQTLNSPTFSASGQVISGSLSVSGGTVNVGTLYLADQNWTSGTVAGNFRLAGGGTLNAGTIASGTGAGSGSSVRTFTWDDGTIANRDASTDLSIGSGITFNLASTGTRRFSLSAGRSGTVASVLAGAGGTLEKVGAGTLVLNAVNTYTGTTTVSEGTLQVGGGTAGRITGDTLVNTGGSLLLRIVSGTLGNVAVAGGRLDLTTNNASIGSLSMTSGTVGLSSSGLRLSIFGNASITGGSVVEPGAGGVINFYGATNVFAPQTLSAGYSFQLHASGNQTFSGSTALGSLNLRGTGIKTVSNSGTITNLSFINDTAGSPVTLKLGSNIAVGSTGLNLAGFSQQGTALTFGVDADAYTLDLSAATGAWTPGTGGTGTTALWTLTGAAGRIIANGFDLSSARVGSSVGPGLILESRAGNSGTNNLSVGTGSGTIDSTSVFRYAGTAAAGTPSTLTSSRAIGDLEVTSGALRITSLAGLQNLRVTGGTLDLNNLSLSVTSGSFGGGSVTSGTLTSATFLATSGSVAASLAGVGGTLTKSTSGTFTLTGANSFTGATNVDAGMLRFDRVAALNSSSGINIAAGTILDYTGATTGTLSPNVTVSSNGTGTIRNSSSQKLTLAGTLTKNGRILQLTGGTFDVTGTIVGASDNSDLLVDGASTVTLLSENTYNGPTFVNQASTLVVGTNNAIPFNSTVTLGNGTSRGTLDLGGNTNAIGGLVFSGSGGTVRMAANQTASPQVATSAGLSLGSNASLDLTGMQTTAGNYRLISSTGITGTFGSVTGLNSDYVLRYGTVNTNEVSAQRKAEFGTITATPAAVKIITGGSTAFSYTVVNATPTDGTTLSFTGSNGANVAGSSNGTAIAGGTSASISGFVFTGTTVGLNQTGSFTLTDPNAITTTANGSVTVDVLNHSLASFASSDVASKTLNFGTYDGGNWSGGDGGSGTLGYSLFNIASLGFTDAQTAGLNFYGWEFASGNDVFSVGFSSFANLAAGSSNNFFATVASPGSLAEGSYTGTYTLKFRDQQDLSGAANTRNLSLTMSVDVVVVPEPGTLALAGLGIAAAAWGFRRRRSSAP